jgi:hypothetical protein
MAGYRRAGLAVLGAIALVLAFAEPASADRMPPPDWSPAPCATGEITEVRHGVDKLDNPTLWISGWIQPCAGNELTDGFAVIQYYPERGYRSRLVSYEPLSSPTSFTFHIGGLRRVLLPAMTALCVAYGYDGRAACIGVDVGSPGGQPVVGPISTGDPRVLVGVRRESVDPQGPTCGTCL